MSNKYWEKRALLIENEAFKNTEYHLQKIKEQYEIAKENIKKEISKFYEDFAINNQIKLADAKKILNNNELKEFKTTLKQYEKLVEEGNEELLQKIKNISIKQRITRLQSLQEKVDIILEQLNNSRIEEIDSNLYEILENTYYRNLYEIENQTQIHTDFTLLNEKILDSILTYNWSGVTYSERIWRNQTELKEKLKDALNKNFIQGNSINELAAEMSRILDTNYKNCTRLLRTEVNYINNRASIEAYKEKEIKQYEFVAVLDLRTSEICADMDGTIINVKDLVTGVNCPPLHPNCRSTVIPYVEGVERNRVARNPETGKIEEVGNLSYKEWYKKYVNEVTEQMKDDIITPNFIRKNVGKNIDTTMDEKAINEAIDMMPDVVKNNLKNTEFEIISQGTTNINNSSYDRRNNKFYIFTGADKEEVIHEIGHYIETKYNVLNDSKYINIRNNGLENYSIYAVQDLINYNVKGITSNKFISEQQGHIYKKDLQGNSYIGMNAKINLNCLGEYFSEGFREYFSNPNNLKTHDIDLYNYIEEVLGNVK